jgi:small-conductance mechanosensitive channel
MLLTLPRSPAKGENPPVMKHPIRSLVLALLLPLAGDATAQIPGLAAASREATAEPPAPPPTIPIAAIPQRVGADERKIQEINQRSGLPAATTAASQELAALTRNVEALEEQTGSGAIAKLPISGLLAVERHLEFLDTELKQLQNKLQTVARPLAGDAAELAQQRKLWQDTRQLSADLMVPALRTSIDDLLREFEKTEATVSESLSQVLSLNREVTSVLGNRVNRTLNTVRSRIAEIDRGLWQVDSESLASALGNVNQQRPDHIEMLLNAIKPELAFTQEFNRARAGFTTAIQVIALLFLPLFWWISRRAKGMACTDAKLLHYQKILTRPFSAWLLLSVAVLVLVQFNGPILRLKLLLIFAWLPVMRLQSNRLHDQVGRWIYLTALCFLINLGSQLVASLPVVFRLAVLSNDLLILATSGWLMHRSWSSLQAGGDRTKKVLFGFSAAGAILAVTAIVANVIGNVSLATMLTDATLSSVYLGLFLLAISNLTRAYARLLFRATAENLRSTTHHAGGLMDVSAGLFSLALLLVWGHGTLTAFRCLRPLQEWVGRVSSFNIEVGSLSFTCGGIVLFCVSVLLSFWLAKTIRGVLAEDILPKMELPRGVANSVSTMSYYSLLMLGLTVALAVAGFHLSQLALVLGALSVGIGFGLQTVVNNFVSGLILMIERPVQPGDIIELAGTIGKVREIGMRATSVSTFEGADVLVPNGLLLSDKLINWTLSSDKRRVDVPVGVAYGNDPETVLALLTEVANRTPGVTRKPPATVLFTGFGASSLDFSVRAWTDSFDHAIFVRSALAVGIHSALKEAGIEIPFPQHDLHLRTIEPELLKNLQKPPSE